MILKKWQAEDGEEVPAYEQVVDLIPHPSESRGAVRPTPPLQMYASCTSPTPLSTSSGHRLYFSEHSGPEALMALSCWMAIVTVMGGLKQCHSLITKERDHLVARTGGGSFTSLREGRKARAAFLRV